MVMQTTINYMSLAFTIALSSALLLGIAKSGVKGLAVLIVTGLALVYGAKKSTGILMPLSSKASHTRARAPGRLSRNTASCFAISMTFQVGSGINLARLARVRQR